MRSLTIQQPFASLIAIGAKRVETRSWRCYHRGEVAIHASKAFPNDYRALCEEDPFCGALIRGGYGSPSGYVLRHRLPLGAIVAVARLVDCRPTSELLGKISAEERAFGDYSEGRYGFILEDVRRLAEPIPCRGALSLWTVPADVEARIREQLEART